MKPDSKKDLPASVRARLLNLAKQRGEDLDVVLKRYGIERLLFRMSQSAHKDAFILKGAMLFELWMGVRIEPRRILTSLDPEPPTSRALKASSGSSACFPLIPMDWSSCPKA